MIKHFPYVFSRALLVAFMIPLLAGNPARAEETQRQITVTGEGQVAATPDMATITLGVIHQAKTARLAMDAMSEATAKVLQNLGDLGIAPSDMQTSSLSLSPVMARRSTSEQGPRKINGFVASNSVHVRLRDLGSLGQVLDVVIDNGANNFNGLRFSVQDPEPLMTLARQQAVGDAVAKAKLLTQAAEVTLGAVLSMAELGGGRPQMLEMAASRGGVVPIAAGEVSVSASVTMVFAIEN